MAARQGRPGPRADEGTGWVAAASGDTPIASNNHAPEIPDIVIRRLPIYQRTLQSLAEEGVETTSSDELAEQIGVTAAQIRRDFSYFGKFGKQGKGYDTAFLAATIARILNLDQPWNVALAGFGNLGRAIARYHGFSPTFQIAAIFDHNEERFGRHVGNVTIRPDDEITEIVRREGIRIGIIAVPAAAAQEVADRMIAGGARALLNYAPVVLRVPRGITVREVDPVGALQSMTYYLTAEESS